MTSPALTKQQIEELRDKARRDDWHRTLVGSDIRLLCNLALSALSEPRGTTPCGMCGCDIVLAAPPAPNAAQTEPETPGTWEQRCAVLYQVLGALASGAGIFETSNDVSDALDVASGRGDVEGLLPWPKDIAMYRALEARNAPEWVRDYDQRNANAEGSRSSAGKDEERQMADILHTMYHHSHHADGTERTEHCCGCWQIRYDRTGLFAFCNECTERRDINEEMTALVAQSKETP